MLIGNGFYRPSAALEAGKLIGGANLADVAKNWPTARAEDAESCGNHPGAVDSLTGAAKNWNTPSTEDYKTDGPAVLARVASGAMLTCDQRLRNQVTHWPTPNVGGGGNPPELLTPHKGHFVRASGKKAHFALDQAAAQWPTPNANNGKGIQKLDDCIAQGHQIKLQDVASSFRLDPATSTPGAASSSTGRKLNPLFVEALMNLPMGWTDYTPLEPIDFGRWEMESSRWLRRTHGARSARTSPE